MGTGAHFGGLSSLHGGGQPLVRPSHEEEKETPVEMCKEEFGEEDAKMSILPTHVAV